LSIFIRAIVVALVIAAAYFDIKYKKIPNKLTLPAVLIGLTLNSITFGLSGTLDSLYGVLIGFALIALYGLGMLGAGDIKLFMAVGALLGWELGGVSIISSILVGGVAGAIVLIMRKNGVKRFTYLYRYLWLFAVTGQLRKYDSFDKDSDAYFSLGSCIAAGTILTMILDFYKIL
jgi:prepilin peptidase CpaA